VFSLSGILAGHYAIFMINQISGKREQNLPTYLLFTGYEKACNNFNYDKIWKILTEDKILPHLIEAIKCLYKNTVICV
jgi:hypothetical protein